jgi:uncharacterized membrane protein YdjX (TVP38/TMEM64 family)
VRPLIRDSRWRTLLLVALLVAVAAAWRAGLFNLHDPGHLRSFIARIRSTPGLPIIFVVAYAVLSAIGVPASALTLAGGALFGAMRGIPLNWLGALAGAMLAFGIVRTLSPQAAVRLLSGDNAVAKLLGGGVPMVLFRLRLIPVVPFSLLNAGAALSAMSWRSYALATALGIVPVTVIYTLFSASLIAGVEGSGARALLTALASAAAMIALTFARRG